MESSSNAAAPAAENAQAPSAPQAAPAEAAKPADAPKPEGTPEPKVAELAKPDSFAAKFAALSRKEKQFRQQAEDFEKSKSAWEAEKKQMEEQYSPYKNLKERLRTQPLDVIKEHGLSFEQLARMVIENDGKPTKDMQQEDAFSALKSELENFKKELAEKDNAVKERERLAEEAKKSEETKHTEKVLQEYVNELTDYVNKNDKYELIRANDAVELVYQVIEKHCVDTNGEVLEMEKAADQVEAYLEEEANKLLELAKIKKKIGAPDQSKEPVNQQGQPSFTLSNALASQAPASGRKFMSDEESKAQAAKLIRWVED